MFYFIPNILGHNIQGQLLHRAKFPTPGAECFVIATITRTSPRPRVQLYAFGMWSEGTAYITEQLEPRENHQVLTELAVSSAKYVPWHHIYFPANTRTREVIQCRRSKIAMR